MSEETFTLKPRDLKIKPLGGASAGVSSFVELLNDPELGLAGGPSPDIPPELQHQAERPGQPEPEPQAPRPPTPLPSPSRKPVGSCLLFSGRLGAGKDYIAEKADTKIFGFADPLYRIATVMCGIEVTSTQNKDVPGMRDFLQKIGQWGRQVVNEKYPYGSERAVFTQLIRAMGSRGTFANPEIEWANYGNDPDLWIKGAQKRIDTFRAETPGKRVAITNARFENEIKYFRALPDWDHWHVMCSPETWAERLAKKKLRPDSKEVNDISEQIAIFLDKDVYAKIRKQPVGNMLRVIWNDHRPPPSRRLYTLAQFLQEVAIAEAVPEIKSDLQVGE